MNKIINLNFEYKLQFKSMYASQAKQLPTNGLYSMYNHSSDSCWLAYQQSLKEIRVLKFQKNMIFTEGFVYQFAPQPIKQIKLIYDQLQQKVYVGILLITKYLIYQNDKQICSHRLKLDRNIVTFQNTFVACDAKKDQKQIYFTFLTAHGQVHIVPVDNIEKKSTLNINAGERFCSIKIVQEGNIVIGTETGKLILADLNSCIVVKNIDTGSNMPILHLGFSKKRVIAITCQGQIINLSQKLSNQTSVSVHQGLVTQFHIVNNRICTFGDDCVLNVFQIDNNTNDLKLRKSQKYTKKVNMIFSMYNSTYLNFYEETLLEEIN